MTVNFNGFAPVPCFSANFPPRLRTQHFDDATANSVVVIGNENTQDRAPCLSSRAPYPAMLDACSWSIFSCSKMSVVGIGSATEIFVPVPLE